MLFEDLLNKRFGLIINNADEEDDIRIFYGEVRNDNLGYYFTNADQKVRVAIDNDLLNRVKKVNDDIRNNFESFENFDYILILTCGNLPDDDRSALIDTGLNMSDRN